MLSVTDGTVVPFFSLIPKDKSRIFWKAHDLWGIMANRDISIPFALLAA